MKNILVIGSVLAVVGLLMALTIPALAHEPANGTTTPTQGQTWEDMYEACQNGDWEAMEEAARGVDCGEYDNMPYHEGYHGTFGDDTESPEGGWSGTGGGHMGNSMMGGGMMGW